MQTDRILLSKERVKNLYSGDTVDRVTFFSNATIFSGVAGKIKSNDFYLNQEKSYNIQKKTLEFYNCDGSPSFDFPGHTGLIFGGEIKFVDNPYVGIPILKYPVNCIEDIDKLKMPNLNESKIFEEKIKFFKIMNKNGISIPISIGSPLEVASNICEITLLLKIIRKDKVRFHKLLNYASEYLKQSGDIIIDIFGIQKCSCSANFPVESLMSKKSFEEHSLPYFYDIYNYFKLKGIKNYAIHLCGNHNNNLEIFKELNMPDRTFISLDEKIDMQKASLLFGENYILGGNVSTSVLINGTSQEVYNISREIIEKNMFRKGGFALMPSCTLPPFTPPDNVIAMHKACEKYGRYR